MGTHLRICVTIFRNIILDVSLCHFFKTATFGSVSPFWKYVLKTGEIISVKQITWVVSTQVTLQVTLFNFCVYMWMYVYICVWVLIS